MRYVWNIRAGYALLTERRVYPTFTLDRRSASGATVWFFSLFWVFRVRGAVKTELRRYEFPSWVCHRRVCRGSIQRS